jgi:hypothetical protein
MITSKEYHLFVDALKREILNKKAGKESLSFSLETIVDVIKLAVKELDRIVDWNQYPPIVFNPPITANPLIIPSIVPVTTIAPHTTTIGFPPNGYVWQGIGPSSQTVNQTIGWITP